MKFKGTARKVGDHIDTDAIIPARFLVTTDIAELGKNCMEGLEPGWIRRVKPDDIMVAGRNFGCGSSREHAPLALLGAGIRLVVAHSFARIFYRNAFNMGLMLFEAEDGAAKIADGDMLEADAASGIITNLTSGATLQCPPLPASMRELVHKGGLTPYVAERLAAQAR
jgi:3-isopropylmalate/(R)-2-methylmalate dehydratase small subunit